jgi:hypothetical protein
MTRRRYRFRQPSHQPAKPGIMARTSIDPIVDQQPDSFFRAFGAEKSLAMAPI